ncbi:MAG: MFS transporter [Planctomycetota bacterium]|jgi:MFS family permease
MAEASIRRNPDFRRLWIGESISFFGSAIRGIAMPLTAVLLLDATPMQMGVLVMLQTLPTLFVSLLAGVWVDRVRRRPIMVGGNVLRACLLASIPLLAWSGELHIVHLYVVSFLLGGIAVLSTVAARAYLPWLLPPHELVRANSRLEISGSMAHLAGPGIGGYLVKLVSAPAALLIDAFALLAGAISIASIRRTEPVPDPKPRHVWSDIKQGLRIVLTHGVLRPIILCGASHNFCSQMIVALQILYMNRALGLDAGWIGLVIAASGPGALLGAASAPSIARRIGMGPTLKWAQVLTGIARLGVPLAGGPLVIPILMASEFLLGFARPLFNINQISLRQRAVPGELQGRVNASFAFLLWGLPPLGAAFGGWLGEWIGMRTCLFVAAAGVLGATAFIQFSPLRNREP